jgi:CRISPR-associated protein Csy2
MTTLLHIPHLQIHNANALSSPYTIGFPAMTAWMGAVHALQRKLTDKESSNLKDLKAYPDLRFHGVGVCCHDFDLQTHKGPGDYIYSIVGTGNPLDKSGNRPAFVEEARCHLKVSLIIECEGIPEQILADEKEMANFGLIVKHHLHTLKMAGGDILKLKPPVLVNIDGTDEWESFTRELMPGFILRERCDLVQAAMQEHEQDALTALMSYLQVEHRCEEDEEGRAVWSSKRKTPGWLVPIATGFHGISSLGQAASQRDPDTPHRFAESVVTLGEFVMPYRLKTLDDLLWYYHVDLEKNLYLCQQKNTKETTDHG